MAQAPDATLSENLESLGEPAGEVLVRISNEIIALLSEQLYQSPLKAIEELVVNAYDAGAIECRIAVPTTPNTPGGFVVVYDNGHGMTREGMVDLWQVGRSKKRLQGAGGSSGRKQIGKFGIGKLATYSIAKRVTYISRTDETILAVPLNYEDFASDPTGAGNPVELKIKKLTDKAQLTGDPRFQAACAAISLSPNSLVQPGSMNWTMVILENLKPARVIHVGRLKWVLSTAMPLRTDFRLYMNGEEIESSKASEAPIVSFRLSDLAGKRLEALRKDSKEDWQVKGDALVSPTFPSGIAGLISVTKQPLHSGKSSELGRSYGFFVRVRGRLINEEDPLFGLKPLSFTTFYRFQAFIDADDLDEEITAPREGVSASVRTRRFQTLLHEIFNEARDRLTQIENEEADKEHRKKEHERDYVYPRLVEHPVADVISEFGIGNGAEADESWFYLEVTDSATIPDLVTKLYTQPRERYTFRYRKDGRLGRLVAFVPDESAFYINVDHEVAMANMDEGRSKVLLEDLATAEVLLEVYLREARVPAGTVGQVLERRDLLLRSLARDHYFSLSLIATSVRDSAADEHDLEVALIAAARALGFVATHVSGPGEPDGVADFVDYATGGKKITLEAKSSQAVPSLGAIDFAGLHEHMLRYSADGCLLVAPAYPAATAEDAAAAVRAQSLKISCWTTEDLARVVEAAELRHFNASTVLDISLNDFSPIDVSRAVDALFTDPAWDRTALYNAVLDSLRSLEGRLMGSVRTTAHVGTEISAIPEFATVSQEDVDRAVQDMAHASKGTLLLSGDRIYMNGSLDEIERRLSGLLGAAGKPRRHGMFRS